MTESIVQPSRHATNPVELMLKNTLQYGTQSGCPPLLAEALNWAVFPGGARVRPRLCLAVAAACAGSGEVTGKTALLRNSAVAGTALELLHCASLVHDDLPCFDDADLRRGKASVQARYGERLAVLAGDALIVHGFEVLSRELPDDPMVAANLTLVLAKGVGSRAGITAGQAWECEPEIDLGVYQRAKTGALFAAATRAGATAAGVTDAWLWAELGNRLGEAFQVADDILDAAGDEQDIGKPAGQDLRLGRPNAVHAHGLVGAAKRLKELIRLAVDSIPECPGRDTLTLSIQAEADRLLPAHLSQLAA